MIHRHNTALTITYSDVLSVSLSMLTKKTIIIKNKTTSAQKLPAQIFASFLTQLMLKINVQLMKQWSAMRTLAYNKIRQ